MPPVNNRNRGAKVSSEWPVIRPAMRPIAAASVTEDPLSARGVAQ